MNAVARAVILDATPHRLGDAIARGLERAVGHLDDPIGDIAERIKCNRRTAQNILRRDHLPNGMHQLRLVAAYPQVRVEIEKLMAAPGVASHAAWLAGDPEWWLPEYERERQQALARAARGDKPWRR